MELLSCCGICMEKYQPHNAKPPKLLSCGHTYCLMCLEKMVVHDTITCPSCRTETPTIPSKLPNNFTIIQILDLPEVKAPDRCDAVASIKCKSHPFVKADSHCHSCDISVCKDCIKSHPSNHSLIPIDNTIKIFRTKIAKSIRQAEEKLEEYIDFHKQDVAANEALEKDFNNAVIQLSSSAEREINNISTLIRNKLQDTIKSMESVYKEHSLDLATQLKSKVERIHSFSEFLTERYAYVENISVVELVRQKEIIENRIKEEVDDINKIMDQEKANRETRCEYISSHVDSRGPSVRMRQVSKVPTATAIAKQSSTGSVYPDLKFTEFAKNFRYPTADITQCINSKTSDKYTSSVRIRRPFVMNIDVSISVINTNQFLNASTGQLASLGPLNANSSFRIVAGLMDSEKISIAVVRRGRIEAYLRHRDYWLCADPVSTDELYKKDSTFSVVHSTNDHGVSLVSHNYPRYCIGSLDGGYFQIVEMANSDIIYSSFVISPL